MLDRKNRAAAATVNFNMTQPPVVVTVSSPSGPLSQWFFRADRTKLPDFFVRNIPSARMVMLNFTVTKKLNRGVTFCRQIATTSCLCRVQFDLLRVVTRRSEKCSLSRTNVAADHVGAWKTQDVEPVMQARNLFELHAVHNRFFFD